MKSIKFIIPLVMLGLMLGTFWPVAHATNYLRMRPIPTATPTPTADTINRKLYGWNCETRNDGTQTITFNSACVGTPASINMLGAAFNLPWWAYETADGTFQDNYIISAANNIGSGQYIAIYIPVGAETEPDWLLAETTNNQPAVIQKTPGVNQKPGLTLGETVFWSRPTDPVFIAKWQALVSHIATTFGPGGSQAAAGAKIARMEVVYMGPRLGNELAQDSNCQTAGGSCSNGVTQICNGNSCGAPACGGSGGFCDRNYNTDAGTAAPGMCGSSACGNTSGGATAYDSAATTTYENAFAYEASQWTTNNDPWALMTAMVPTPFPNLASTGGTSVSDGTVPANIAPWLSTQFTKPSYLFNEALGDGTPGGYTSLMHNTNHWCGYNISPGHPFLCIAQMNSALGTNLKISSIVGNGTTATVTYTCTTSSRTANNCLTSIGITAGDTLNVVGTNATYNGNHTVLASPAPNNTVSPYTVSFSTSSSTTFTGTNQSEVVDTSRETSNCTALKNAFANGNSLNVLEIETYESDYTTCPVTVATQYALMPSS